MEKPLFQDYAAGEPLAGQQKLGQGTYQPGGEMSAEVEGPFFLGVSEARGEEAPVRLAESGTISAIRGENGLPC